MYVGTGNGYADPSQPMTDAVVALDIKSGKVRWFHQLTPNDNWTLGCRATNPDNPNCPATLGPDHDFSASPALVTAGGRDLLVVPQKSGMAYALDPDKAGRARVAATDSARAAAAAASGAARRRTSGLFRRQRLRATAAGGVVAVDLATGERAWHQPGGATALRRTQPRLQPRRREPQ